MSSLDDRSDGLGEDSAVWAGGEVDGKEWHGEESELIGPSIECGPSDNG